MSTLPNKAATPKRFALYTNSAGNYFFEEIRDLIAAGLRELGHEARYRDEREGFDGKADWHLVLAPHEFFELGAGRDLARGKMPGNLILFSTEQPTSKWHQLCAKYFERAAAIWDIEFESSLRNRKSGYACNFLPLGYAAKSPMFREIARLPLHDETRALSAEARDFSGLHKPISERPLDALFLGHLSGRREQYFARHQEKFARLNCFFHKPVVMRPMIPGQTTNMDTTTSVGLAQRSKILLNIHHGKDRYFEWHRIVLLGIAQRALVVTEPCSIAPPFAANVDYVEAPLDELPDRIEYYLKSPAGQAEAQRMVDHAFETLTNRCKLADVLRPLIDELTEKSPQRQATRFFPIARGGTTAERALSICVVTPDAAGGGAQAENGSSQNYLAESLARAGHQVTLLDTAPGANPDELLGELTRNFAALGVEYISQPTSREVRVESSEACQRSYETYWWLREQKFDVVHFPEAHGIGFYSLLAQRQGLELGGMKFCVHAHQPASWKRQATQKLVNIISDLELDYLEAECLRMAPTVAATTGGMLAWLEGQKLRLPEQKTVRPFAGTTISQPGRGEKIRELIYVGPLSRCPGLTMFCAALDRLGPEKLSGVKVIFGGSADSADDTQGGDFMTGRLQNRNGDWEVVIKKTSELIEFARGPGRLVVMPAPMDNSPDALRRCLSLGVPFLTADRADARELIDPADHRASLFSGTPTGLAEALEAALKNGVNPAHTAADGEARWQEWMKWHNAWAEEKPAAWAENSTRPLVSVCLVHFNRPQYLKQSLASLRAQDYANFEVIVIDDGSTQPEALQYLKSLEPEFAQRNWQLVRQENRYLGAARNFGAKHARGEYLMFMDDDNYAKPNEISTFVRVATNTGADILTCAMDVFTGTDAPETNGKVAKRFVFLGGAAEVGVVRNCFGDANGFMRREAFERVGGFTEDYGITHEDWEFYARATLAGCRIETMPQALFWYRMADTSMNRTTPLYANLQRSLRPYVEAVPPQLRGLMQFVLGSASSPITQALPIAADQSLGRLHERLIAMAQDHIRAGQHNAAEPLLLDIIQSAQATRNLAVVVRTLLAVAKMLVENGKAQTAIPLVEAAQTYSKTLNAPLFSKEADALMAVARRGGKPAPTVAPKQNPQSSARAAQLFQAPVTQTKSAAAPAPAEPKHTLASIIVLAHNQWPDTQRCLESLARHTPERHEIILVDNGSTDGTAKYFQDYAAKNEHVRAVINRENRGFSAGNNQGLATARGSHVVLLNNDTVVTPGWLGRMLATLDRHPEAGMAGPMSNRVSGPQLVEKVDYSALEELPAFAENFTKANEGKSMELARAVGFCLVARREVIQAIGGLDESFGSGNFEDDDFCIRAQMAGFRIRAAQDAFVHHVGGQTFKGAKIDYRASMSRNWEIFKKKWGMAKDLAMETGYRLPTQLPASGFKIALPTLKISHRLSVDGRTWTDKMIQAKAGGAVAVELPPSALMGSLTAAQELRKRKEYGAAWKVTTEALEARPYHPEAYLLLAEIAKTAGNGVVSQRLAKHAKELAPGWNAPKQFLKSAKPYAPNGIKPADLGLAEAINEFDHDAARTPRLTVCMIVKNEEKFIGQCLKSIMDLAWQIVVVDTGSTDRTAAIAQEHGAEVYQFKWQDDFSAARNAALERARGDWVLSLDADEELLPEHKETLRQEMRAAEAMAYRLPIIDKGREQEGCSYVPRLFRNAPGLFFLGRVHEQAFSSIEVRCAQWGLKHLIGKAALFHHGYTPELVKDRNKIERNLKLLELAIEELPNDPNLLMNYGLELARSGQLQEGISYYLEALRCASELPPSQVTPEMRETLLTQLTMHLLTAKLFDQVIKIWQMPFAKAAEQTASQHFTLGLAYMELKQPALAAEQMRLCLAKREQPTFSPRNAEVMKAGPAHCLALCLTHLQQPVVATEFFNAAIAIDPKARAPRVDFARFLAETGKPLDALKWLNQVLGENPADLEVWRLGGQIALSKPEFRAFSCDWTGEAIKHFPQEPSIIFQRAEALFLAERAPQALLFWKDARLPKQARSDAARVLCEILIGKAQTEIAPSEERAISQEALKWYRRLIAVGAVASVHALNQKIEAIRGILPSFVAVWETATRKATAAATQATAASATA